MKRILSLMLTIALILSIIPTGLFGITVSAASTGTTGGCTWSLDGTILTISGTGAMERYYSYYRSPWGTSITEVVIENGVTNISDWAFYGCSRLASVTIPESVTHIGDSSFDDCSSLTEVHITNLMAWCNIKFYDFLSNPLFYSRNLYINGNLATDIIIPDNVTKIENYAFYNCSSLTSVTIADSVTSIGDRAFKGCDYLKSISVDDNNKYFFSQNGVLFNKDEQKIIQYPAGKVSLSYAVPDGITSIGDYAFYNCDHLRSITIPNGVTSIGNYAFSDCSKLTSITIPNSVTSIGNFAFSDCSKLTSITLPDSVTSIGESCFRRCSNLDTIVIPKKISTIPVGAFNGCSNLKSITLPAIVRTIASSAFVDCPLLDDVWFVGDETDKHNIFFAYNNGLTSVEWHFNSCPNGGPHSYANECDATCDCGYVRKVAIEMGDVNADKNIGVADTVTLLRVLAGNSDDYNINRFAADMDYDGDLTTADVVAILQLMLNKRYY